MKALILCGGLGTRLRNVVSDVPKPMALVNNKPFLEYILNWLTFHGIRDVIFLAGYKADKIEEYFHDKFKGMNLRYSIEPKPLGTAGAIKYASQKYDIGKDFILINGDTYFDLELENMIEFHKSKSALATIALKLSDNTDRYGLVSVDDTFKITKFLEKEKSKEPGFINAGVYVLNHKILDLIPLDKAYSIEKEIFPQFSDKEDLYGYPDGGRFIDIGIPADYKKAQNVIPLWEKEKKRKAFFLDRDGVIIEDTGYVHSKDEVKFLPGVVEALKKINESGSLCIVVSNQAGVAHGYYTEKDVVNLENHIEQELKKLGVRIDAFYYCPYHPEAKVKEYKKDSIYRKPKPGMILRAAEEFNISLSKSLMIGDKESDRIKLPQLRSYVIKSKYVHKWDFESLSDAISKLIGE